MAVYPLRQEHLGPAIRAVIAAFTECQLTPDVGPMSTTITGDADRVFAALRDGFATATATGEVVMTVTVSNACPIAR
ncbi:MAG TPA: YkoF family thiamine/hydroxymethylpyrimidine-binding protein [Methylomirabilota bacterium]|nr:YkoF family thiamine/hydroxymethylpyrimidine-binding protein [Methylomirabilota bacterium]